MPHPCLRNFAFDNAAVKISTWERVGVRVDPERTPGDFSRFTVRPEQRPHAICANFTFAVESISQIEEDTRQRPFLPKVLASNRR